MLKACLSQGYAGQSTHFDVSGAVTSSVGVANVAKPVNKFGLGKNKIALRHMRKQKSNVEHYSLQLHGPVRVLCLDGSPVAIESRKGMALLALLATSPDMERERSWLTGMLWGSRGHEQAQSSLRQELSRLKKILNRRAVVIDATRLRVRLSAEYVSVLDPVPGADFLEGMDIPGEEAFEDWLRMQRLGVSRQPQGSQPEQFASAGPELSISVGIECFTADDTSQEMFFPHFLHSAVSQSLTEFGGLLVMDGDMPPADARLTLKLLPDPDQVVIVTVLQIASSGRTLLSLQRRLSALAGSHTNPLQEVSRLANELSEHVLVCLSRHEALFREPGHLACVQLMRGIETHFSRKENAAQFADDAFQNAIDKVDQSSFWAWRAYNIALFLEDDTRSDIDKLSEQAVAYSKRALDIDPHNGLTLALLTHVYAFVLRDFERAGDCLSRAIKLRADSVMTRDASALLRLYTGDFVGARADAFKAELGGRHLSHRYCFATTQAMIETLSGNYVAAVRHGERALSMMPIGDLYTYKPTLRYLGISYAQSGAEHSALQTFEKLASLEGELKSSDLGDRAYPMPSEEAIELLRESLKRLGK